jgi:polar amino acid transport system ATP-binding protein
MTSAKGSKMQIPTPDVSLSTALELPAVFVRGARKSFGDREVLRGIDFQINRGEVVSLIGPSGAGKTTLLRCLTLLDTFDAGQFAYGSTQVTREADDGRATYDKDSVRRARMQFGIVFQNYNLFPHYTVLKNVCDAPIVVQGRDPDRVEKEARELLERLGMAEHADKVPNQLSGGQQQRVAIARALAMKPKVLYFDEATSALDPKLTADMHDLIRELAGDGMAIGIVTHEMGFARDVADRVVFMEGGVVVEQGKPEKVFDHPENQRTAEFLGSIK